MNINPFSISCLLLTITCATIIIIALFAHRNTHLHKIWTWFNFAVFIWGLSSFLITQVKDIVIAEILWKIGIIGVIYTAVLFFHIVYIFSKFPKGILIVAYIQSFIGVIAALAGLLTHLQFIFNSFYYVTSVRWGYPLIYSSWVAMILYGQYVLFKTFRSSKGILRIQLFYFFVGTCIGFSGGAVNFLPVFGIKIYPYSNFLISAYCIIATYAIFKYRLMDITVAITRTGLFIVVYTVVLGLPFAMAVSFKEQLIQFFGDYWWMSPFILMAALATGGPFIYIYVEGKAEDRLLKEQRQYQNILKEASIGMTRIRDLHRLLDLITHIVTKTVRISYAAIYLYNEQNNEYILQVMRDKGRTPVLKLTADNPLMAWITVKREPLIYEEIKRQMEDTGDETYKHLEKNMQLLTAAVIIPSFLENRFMGFIVLGDKVSGQIYTPEDLEVFQVLASQAALAIENAQFYDETQKMQEQVAQAEKMATIGTMADGLSHQINNRFYALSLIAGDSIDTIKLTDTSKCTPEVKEMIDHINHALERIQANVIQGGEVVKGLLKYSRKGDESFTALTLDQVLDGTLEMVQFKVKLSEIDIVRDYPKDIPNIKGNLVQLEEVFFNFIDNAYDAIVERRTTLKEDGYRGRITISARGKDSVIEITLEDNGMGIKDENLNKAFTPFFTTKTSARQGTGLGLYVIRRIIADTHKGKIALESSYKVGTRFIIELPIAK